MSSIRTLSESAGYSYLLFLSRVRVHTAVNYSIIVMLLGVLLSIYYTFLYSLPIRNNSWVGWFWECFFFEYKNGILGALLLLPALYAFIMLNRQFAFLFLVVIIVTLLPYIITLAYKPEMVLKSLSLIAIPPVLLLSIEMKLVADSREKTAREESEKQRMEIVRQRLRAQEEERRRISQELHDSVAQSLLAIAATACDLAENDALDASARAGLDAVHRNSLEAVDEIRMICQALRPSLLDTFGLVPAIRGLVSKIREETDLRVQLTVYGQVYELPPEESLAVFRVVQESLSNVTRHADAQLLLVAFKFYETQLTIEITDDGKGFDTGSNVSAFALRGKLGLLGMCERARAIGGEIHVESRIGVGTTVVIVVNRRSTIDSANVFYREPDHDSSITLFG